MYEPPSLHPNGADDRHRHHRHLICRGHGYVWRQSEKAKIAASKANHKNIVKYMTVEVLSCSLGEPSVMNGNLNCPITNSSQIITAIHKTSTGISDSFKNPYNPTESAMNKSWYDYNNDANIGRTLMGQNAWNNVLLATCFKLPCNNAKNRNISYVYMD